VVIISPILAAVFYWVFAAAFTMAEHAVSRSRKIQPDVTVPPEEWRGAALRVLQNQVIVNVPVMYAYWLGMPYLGWSVDRPLPTLLEALGQTVVFILIEECLLYGFHRGIHTIRVFYHLFHSQHHEYHAPTAVTSLAAHPIDHLFVNFLPALMGPIVMRAHLVTTWMWLLLSTMVALESHTGYDFSPIFVARYRHDYHHSHGHAFYGSLGLLDWLFGTNKMEVPAILESGKHLPLKTAASFQVQKGADIKL
jgi:sterol desaturase/sphingolipid hydroxylase (fatty acid hydroxylase superfamily)